MFSLETLVTVFSQAMNEVPKGDIGIAVSGGGDSLALLYLTAEWSSRNGRTLQSATIDHQLRPESKSECEYVKKLSIGLSIKHTTLTWLEKPDGNMQGSARSARHRLLSRWAVDKNLTTVLFGHTLEDNAETLLIRLSRGSGIDGLTGMRQSKNINNLQIFRPLLKVSRNDLRSFLSIRKVNWIDEPSNFDERFHRVRIRNSLPQLANLGLTTYRLIALAEHMSRAREALNLGVLNFARVYVQQMPWGDLEIEQEAFVELSREYQLRLLAASLRWISSRIYRPRFESLKRLLNSIVTKPGNYRASLMGCIVNCRRKKIILSREFAAVPKRQIVVKSKFIWDKKWSLEVDPTKINHSMVGPLGEIGINGIKIKDRKDIPVDALKSSFALFEKNEVMCVPILSYGTGIRGELLGGSDSFLNFLSTC